ncbi:unnamed protein product [Closterium sp. NIES-54]
MIHYEIPIDPETFVLSNRPLTPSFLPHSNSCSSPSLPSSPPSPLPSSSLQVIHYEIPNDPETFVHRSGRTGRAGKTGCTILMYTDSQVCY